MKDTISHREYRELLESKDKKKAKFSHVKRGWYCVAGVWYFFRSRAEFRFALILERWKQRGDLSDWKFEPWEFDFPGERHGVTRYTPDFVDFNDTKIINVYEVKGRLNSGDLKKIKLFKKYYPNLNHFTVGPEWWKTYSGMYSFLPSWNMEPLKKAQLPEGAVFRDKTTVYEP